MLTAVAAYSRPSGHGISSTPRLEPAVTMSNSASRIGPVTDPRSTQPALAGARATLEALAFVAAERFITAFSRASRRVVDHFCHAASRSGPAACGAPALPTGLGRRRFLSGKRLAGQR